MKVLLVSDAKAEVLYDYFDAERFGDVDLIISCGDLRSSYLSYLVSMTKADLVYVPGNHDGEYLKNPPEGCISADDQIITVKGLRILGLGGCMGWSGMPYQYSEKEMRKRVRRLWWQLRKHKGFDILLTHAPARHIGDGEDLCHMGFTVFRDLMDKYQPKWFFHGHQHLNYGRGQRIHTHGETTIINAFRYHLLEL